MKTDEEGFKAYLTERPGDDTARFAFADWCDENARPQQARYLRSIRREKFARRVRVQSYRIDPFTGARLTIPEVIYRFSMYLTSNPVWGDIHIVLDDGNYADSHVQWCYENAETIAGKSLSKYLLSMSPSQRGRIADLCDAVLHFTWTRRFDRYQRASYKEIEGRCRDWPNFIRAFRKATQTA